jgi:hypothetical protein
LHQKQRSIGADLLRSAEDLRLPITPLEQNKQEHKVKKPRKTGRGQTAACAEAEEEKREAQGEIE